MPKVDIEVILKELYPKVKAKATPAMLKNFKKLMGDFIETRYIQLYDIAPCDRIVFSKEDELKFFTAIDISEEEVDDIIKKTYYGNISAFRPKAAKDPFTVLLLTFIRYLILVDKDKKNIDLALIYISFSGKFYPSIHYGSYPTFTPSEYRHVMEYVVNNELSQKYDIKREGSIIKAVVSVAKTWMETYMDRIKDFNDEDIVYLIQQLHNRISSFTHNIAEIYYDVYENKKDYMTYDSDSMDEENYRLADSDSLMLERAVESTMIMLTSSNVDYARCKTAANGRVKTDELKGIIESILQDSKNIPLMRELVTSIIADYFTVSKTKDLKDQNFLATAMTAKPNSKNPRVERQKEILEEFLDVNSPAYRKKKNRLATKLAYNKSLHYYIILTIHKAA